MALNRSRAATPRTHKAMGRKSLPPVADVRSLCGACMKSLAALARASNNEALQRSLAEREACFALIAFDGDRVHRFVELGAVLLEPEQHDRLGIARVELIENEALVRRQADIALGPGGRTVIADDHLVRCRRTDAPERGVALQPPSRGGGCVRGRGR